MPEELHLVTDLAVILIAAGIFTLLFKALKQPLILGYIIAGFLVGPHLGLFPELTSTEAVGQWSEIGIIFLLFSLGLEFSIKKLLGVGSTALIMAVTICAGMFVTGLVTGNAIGWSMMESIFLGGMLSMSSTTIILKAFTDMGLKDKPYAPMVFGCLVIEDMIAVLLMVLLSTLAVSSQSAGREMVFGICKLTFFLVLCFLVGIYVLPTLLKKAEKYLSDEILLLVSIGLCFGMVTLAGVAGFSSALGAFVMGSLLAETTMSERIIKLTGGIKDLFGAIFFVSVGMMIDPAVIGQYWGIIVVITLIAMLGLFLFSTTGALLAGQGLDNSVHAGVTMSQIGEFSFIIASLGVSLGVLRGYIYPVIITVSVVTTFLTPYMIKAGDPVSKWLYRILPPDFIARIDPKTEEPGGNSIAEKSEWRHLLKSLIIRMALYGVLMLAVLIASGKLLDPLLARLLPDLSDTLRNALCCAITTAALIPFIAGFLYNTPDTRESVRKLLVAKGANRWPILSLFIIRTLIAIIFVLSAILSHFKLSFWAILLIVAVGYLIVLFGRNAIHGNALLENRFMQNFNEKDRIRAESQPIRTSVSSSLSGYDIHLEKITVEQNSPYAGKHLRDLPFRHSSGANIVKIQRGPRSILIPGGDEPVYPMDELLAVGSSEQIKAFRELMTSREKPAPEPPKEFSVEKILLDKDSLYVGKSLREISMRRYGCMVISILRDGKLITNPVPDTVFRVGDTVWIAGEKDSVRLCIS